MRTAHRQRGSSLIEVLISLVLVAVTMLGLLGLQLRSMSLQKDSLDRRNASVLIAGMADRISGNFDGFVQGRYSLQTMGITDNPPTNNLATACAVSTTCTVAEVSRRDWELFQIETRARLPNGVAGLRMGPNNSAVIVTVGWRDPQRLQELTALLGSAVDQDPADNIDDACARINVNDQSFRCVETSVFP